MMSQRKRADSSEVTGVQDLLERLRLSSDQQRRQQEQQQLQQQHQHQRHLYSQPDATTVLFGSPHTPNEADGYFSRRNSHGSMDSFWDEVRSACGDREAAETPFATPSKPAPGGPPSDFGPSESDNSENFASARDEDIQAALDALGDGLSPARQQSTAAAERSEPAEPLMPFRPPGAYTSAADPGDLIAANPALHDNDELLLLSEMEQLQAEQRSAQYSNDPSYQLRKVNSVGTQSSGSGLHTPPGSVPPRLTASQLSTFTTSAGDSMMTTYAESCFEDSESDDEGLLRHTSAKKAKESLEHLELIGRGAFGSVYQGTWKGRRVAVKVVEGDDDLMNLPGLQADDEYLETASRRSSSNGNALLEAAVSSAVIHPNVVQTYDYRVFDPDQPVLNSGASFRSPLRETRIIMEFCDAGNLEEAVQDGRLDARSHIGLHHICKTLTEVVDAMLYLHRLQVTHRDLKPKNVLLQSCRDDSRGFVAKVSDFGLSKLLPENSSKGNFPADQAPAGTVTHMSPEALSEGVLSTAADVYAFGIMMWEVFTGRAPYQRLSKMQVMAAVVNEGLRPQFPPHCPVWYAALATACWQQDPEQRITFEEVRRTLRNRYWDGPSAMYH